MYIIDALQEQELKIAIPWQEKSRFVQIAVADINSTWLWAIGDKRPSTHSTPRHCNPEARQTRVMFI